VAQHDRLPHVAGDEREDDLIAWLRREVDARHVAGERPYDRGPRRVVIRVLVLVVLDADASEPVLVVDRDDGAEVHAVVALSERGQFAAHARPPFAVEPWLGSRLRRASKPVW